MFSGFPIAVFDYRRVRDCFLAIGLYMFFLDEYAVPYQLAYEHWYNQPVIKLNFKRQLCIQGCSFNRWLMYYITYMFIHI